MGSMGSVEPMEFQKGVPEPMDFEQIVKQMKWKKAIKLEFSLKIGKLGAFYIFFYFEVISSPLI